MNVQGNNTAPTTTMSFPGLEGVPTTKAEMMTRCAMRGHSVRRIVTRSSSSEEEIEAVQKSSFVPPKPKKINKQDPYNIIVQQSFAIRQRHMQDSQKQDDEEDESSSDDDSIDSYEKPSRAIPVRDLRAVFAMQKIKEIDTEHGDGYGSSSTTSSTASLTMTSSMASDSPTRPKSPTKRQNRHHSTTASTQTTPAWHGQSVRHIVPRTKSAPVVLPTQRPPAMLGQSVRNLGRHNSLPKEKKRARSSSHSSSASLEETQQKIDELIPRRKLQLGRHCGYDEELSPVSNITTPSTLTNRPELSLLLGNVCIMLPEGTEEDETETEALQQPELPEQLQPPCSMLVNTEKVSTVDTSENRNAKLNENSKDDDDDSSIVLEHGKLVSLQIKYKKDDREDSCFSFYINLEEELLDASFMNGTAFLREDAPRETNHIFDSSSNSSDNEYVRLFDAIWESQRHLSFRQSSRALNQETAVEFIRIVGTSGTMIEC